ncbi:MAG: PKD domain-containing protein [Acidobacteriota bacterium]
MVRSLAFRLAILSLFACSALTDARAALRLNPSEAPAAAARTIPGRIAFAPNLGQTDPSVRFTAVSGGATVFLTGGGVTLLLSSGVDPAPPRRPGKEAHPLQPPKLTGLRIVFPGASQALDASGLDPLPGVLNVYRGKDPSRWRTGIPLYGRVRMEGLYPGVDVEYRGVEGGLEFDLLVEPGVRPESLAFRVEDLEGRPLRLKEAGHGTLRVRCGGREIRLGLPHVFQGEGPERREIPGRFRPGRRGTVGFHLEGAEGGGPTVIDPTMLWGTYLGGSNADRGYRLALDSSANVYLTGLTMSTDFPVDLSTHGDYDVFVVKFTPDGQSLLYSTLIGGLNADVPLPIAVDVYGHAYVGGYTTSPEFPVVGGFPGPGQGSDGFLVKLNTTGQIAYSAVLGGMNMDQVTGVAVRETGKAYLTGLTYSSTFPLAGGPGDSTLGGLKDAFVSIVDTLLTGGASLLYSSFLGGSGTDEAWDVRVDAAGRALLVGSTGSSDFPVTPDTAFQPSIGGSNDAWVGLYNPFVGALPPGLVYGSFLGGSAYDAATAVEKYGLDRMVVTGFTYSGNFPTVDATQPAFGGGEDAFVALVDPSFSGPTSLLFSTYVGGTGNESGYAIAVSSYWELFVTGYTSSSDFPLADPLPGMNFLNGPEDAFVCQWEPMIVGPQQEGKAPSSAMWTLLTSTYLGGADEDYGEGIAWHQFGPGDERVFVSGSTRSSDFPTGNAFQYALNGPEDAFLVSGTESAPCTVACSGAPDVDKGLAPLVVTFTGTATPSNCTGPAIYFWDFGDDTTSSVQNPTHTYSLPGSYNWTLTVTVDGVPCTASGTVEVCELTCVPSAPPWGFVGVDQNFSIAPDFGGCGPVTYSYAWSFQDGFTAMTQDVSHAFAAPGTYTWEAHVIAAAPGPPQCDVFGSIEICGLDCTAMAAPSSGGAPLAVTFTGTSAVSGACPHSPVYFWDFGDGATSTEASPIHVYSAPGIYTWFFEASTPGAACTRTGTVEVSASAGVLYGFVGIQGESLLPLNGDGIVSATVTARNVSTGERTAVPVVAGQYVFPTLSDGEYELRATVTYWDNILFDARLRNFGCEMPSGGRIEKTVERILPDTVNVLSTGEVQADIAFPPPVVFLHGLLDCFKKWFSSDPQDPDLPYYWDNKTRAAGFFAFTPNYVWWGPEATWAEKSYQVFDQVTADLHGLHTAPIQSPSSSIPPWTLAAHDMGGLVARVLASGELAHSPQVRALRSVILLGVPNSGSDFLLGGGGSEVVGTEAIVRRFNGLYPDFGSHADRVYAVGGNKDWWGTGTSDGKVSLYSAFVITRLACSETAFGYPACRPYPAVVFDNGPGHIFPYTHAELGSPPSTAEILEGVLFPLAETLGPSPANLLQTAAAPDDENPLSPIGQAIWGTTARSTGTKGGTVNAFAGLSVTQTFPFTVGATDGLALSVFVSDGAGTFTLSNPQGAPVASTSADDDFVWSVLNPEEGEWTLAVTVDSGSVTFRATSFENSPAGIQAYLTQDRYAPGESALLRLDLEGDPADLVFSSVTAYVTAGGSVLETVSLYDDGQHGDGQAGDGSFGGTATAPLQAGSYPVLFSAQGTYNQRPVTRIAHDTLFVVPPEHLFGGTFSDGPVDTDEDGLFEALEVSALVNVSAPGTYGLSGDLFDGEGYFLAHAGASFTAPAAGPFQGTLTFDLSGISCGQVGSAFSAENLRVLDGATLRPLDAWGTPVATAAYPAGSFECDPSPPGPRIRALRPDEGIQGQTRTFLISGNSFRDGAMADLGAGVSVQEVTFLSESVLSVRAAVSPSALPGPRIVTVTNPGGASASRTGAFEVVADAPPSVALLTPAEAYLVLGASDVAVTALATDDVQVERVDFLVDGAVQASVTEHPFTWTLSPGSLSSGAHAVTARAYDGKGQSDEASFLAVKDPPAITAVTKMAAPFRIKLTGQNFQAGAQVYIGSDSQPWPSTTVKNSTKVILGGGAALKAKFPKGQAVTLRLVNPDGGWCTATYTRP